MFNCDARVKLSSAFQFIEISVGNINGTHVYPAFHRKIPQNNSNFEKLALLLIENLSYKRCVPIDLFTDTAAILN